EFDASKARLTTWLHRMAHNLAIDHLRKAQRDAPWDDEEDRRAASDSPEEQSGKDVREALLKLPERQRSALALTYYQDLSNREVAEVMGLGTRAVESLLVRARGALKQQLEIAS
ncbi:MAG: sigma-70 family RNA polymerase sigma factor, partial [Cellvibrionales bacterium]